MISANYNPPFPRTSKISKKLSYILNLLNKIFENDDEQRHIDDNKFLVPKHESETRILLLLQIIAGSLICLTISLIWIILSKIDGSIIANPTTTYIGAMPVENLYLIYDSGLALDISRCKDNANLIPGCPHSIK